MRSCQAHQRTNLLAIVEIGACGRSAGVSVLVHGRVRVSGCIAGIYKPADALASFALVQLVGMSLALQAGGGECHASNRAGQDC